MWKIVEFGTSKAKFYQLTESFAADIAPRIYSTLKDLGAIFEREKIE